MDSTLIILPHQLYGIDKYYQPVIEQYSIKSIILWEHPQYFTKYKYNKKRLLLHRASMKLFARKLENQFKTIRISYWDVLDNKKFPDGSNKIYMYDPIDKIHNVNSGIKILDTPNFLLSNMDLEAYRKKTTKFFFNSFYMWGKKIVDIIPTVKSKDIENRKSKLLDPLPPVYDDKYSREELQILDEAARYVNKHFSGNYGTTDGFNFPISHEMAGHWLSSFLKHRFKLFGPYEDTIVKDKDQLFHSVLSSSINIGLINPLDIIEDIRPLKSKIPIASYEGYIRQLYWREYQRLCYLYFDFSGLNYFGGKKKLDSSWYTGALDCPPVDDAIKDAFNTGYLHHIRRLMVVGNYMMLNEIEPMEGFKWFMEFSLDSYEWVMMQNVLEMVFCVSGGKTMRKPYISSSNYVLKMSDYSRGEWSKHWDQLFYDFLKGHRDKMHKFRYAFPMLGRLTKKATDV